MSRVVYLHVGAPKTGTTYIQDRLRVNRRELGRHGVHYPIGLLASHFRPALDLLQMSWPSEDDVTGEWDALVSRARRCEGTVVISHEILASAAPEKVQRAMDAFAKDELHIVYSARDLARQIPAEWQEGVKHRQRRSFSRFLTQVQASPRQRSKMWFWRVQGLPDVLGRWSAGLPPENVHLITVPQAGSPRGTLWRRFCSVVGIDPDWAPVESAQENRSIGTAETAMLRRLNRRLRTQVDDVDYRRLVRQLVVHETLAHRKKMTRTTLPPHLFPWAAEVADEWVDWVEGSGIDVVGDVAELRPVPPDDDTWSDPDHPQRADMFEAAMDALVAMTIEAASRPDPDAQLTAKLGRAARRLRGQ